MAQSRKKREVKKSWNKAKWKGFVNLTLQRTEKKAIKENLLEEAAGLEFLMNAATEGYKCSLSYSIPEDVFTISLTGQYQEKPNSGLTMSLRHKEAIVALSGLAWILREDGLLQEWEKRFGKTDDDDW